MDIVVSDTNILVDLYTIKLLREMCRLPIRVHTVDFVINELTEGEQREEVDRMVDDGMITVKHFTGKEMGELIETYETCGGNLSIADCAVWDYARENGYRLLTCDRQLKNKAMESGVKVNGILYIFDELVLNGILEMREAAKKLEALRKKNNRLPHDEVEMRIGKWEK